MNGYKTFFLNSAGSLGTASHSYLEEGTYTVSVTVENFTSQSQTQTFTITVSDAPLDTSGITQPTLQATEGQSLGNVTVASFHDPGK